MRTQTEPGARAPATVKYSTGDMECRDPLTSAARSVRAASFRVRRLAQSSQRQGCLGHADIGGVNHNPVMHERSIGRCFPGVDDVFRRRQFRFRRRKNFVDRVDLRGVNAPFAVEPERAALHCRRLGPIQIAEISVRAVDRAQSGRTCGRKDAQHDEMRAVAAVRIIPFRTSADVEPRHAQRCEKIARTVDERFRPWRGDRDCANVGESGSRFDLRFDADFGCAALCAFERTEQAIDGAKIISGIYFRNEDEIDPAPGLFNQIDQIAREPGRADRVDPDRARFRSPLALVDCFDDEASGVGLGSWRDGIFEIEKGDIGR